MHGLDRGTLNDENLMVIDRKLAFSRRIFVDCRGQMRVQAYQIRDTARVVTMPMCEKHLRYGDILFCQNI